MLKWLYRLTITTALLALVATNVLTLTHSAFNSALSGAMGTYLGVRTVSGALQAKLAGKDARIAQQRAVARQQKSAARRFGTRLTARTKRVAAKSIAAIPAESIPFLGVAVLIADTGYELYAACETLTDLEQLYRDLDLYLPPREDALHAVCNPKLPDVADVRATVMNRLLNAAAQPEPL